MSQSFSPTFSVAQPGIPSLFASTVCCIAALDDLSVVEAGTFTFLFSMESATTARESA